MHSALFVAQVDGKADWQDFLTKAKVGLRTYPGVSRLAENVWIVNFQESPAPLAWFVCAADALGVPYGILPLERAPEWLPVGLDPKTIWVQNEDS